MAEPIRARFDKLRRDLYWNLWHEGREFKWGGYDDRYWWDNVAPKPETRRRTVDGITLELDFKTGIVTVLKLPPNLKQIPPDDAPHPSCAVCIYQVNTPGDLCRAYPDREAIPPEKAAQRICDNYCGGSY